MEIHPYSPAEAKSAKIQQTPIEVIASFNELLAARYVEGRVVTIKNVEVINLIIQKNSSYTSEMIYKNHWLDIEDMYRASGWTVEYDKPGYNETYEAVFRFTVKK